MSYGKYYPASLDYDGKVDAFYIKLRLTDLGSSKIGYGDLKKKLKEALVARNDGIMLPDQNFLDDSLRAENGREVTDRTFYLDQDGFTKLMRIYFK